MEEIASPKLTNEFLLNLKILTNFSSQNHLHDVRIILNNNLPDASHHIEQQNSINKGEYSWPKIKKAMKHENSKENHSEEYWMRKYNELSKHIEEEEEVNEQMILSDRIIKP
eukprot:gene1912-1052_t